MSGRTTGVGKHMPTSVTLLARFPTMTRPFRLALGNAKALNDRGFVFASKGDFEVAIRDYGQANST
jgi:hypothetical protein